MMAADSRITDDGGSMDLLNFPKIKKVKDCVVGFAGDVEMGVLFFSWIERGEPDDPAQKPQFEDDDFAGLAMRKNGVYWYGKRLIPGGIASGCPAAIGSGGDVALGAMLAGKSPAEAVRLACKVDTNSGGRVNSFKL
ncbi:MAG: hypothetical protein CMO74_15240 [Verrucomicrobiales bacterium]|nr:hypothetical protein [Verrucomicrobiales bacterium]|tara:strand:+ start:86 stop:496 length:411 start_codon:yes stop_codon:yes gene_type:complete